MYEGFVKIEEQSLLADIRGWQNKVVSKSLLGGQLPQFVYVPYTRIAAHYVP